MNFRIGSHGIESVAFTVSLDDNSAQINLEKPPGQSKEAFYRQREKTAEIFHANYSTLNYVARFHGRYSQDTLQHLTKTADILVSQSIIDAQKHNEILLAIQDMVEKVKIEHGAEVARFAPFLSDFTKAIPMNNFYCAVDALPDDIPLDNSIRRIERIMEELTYYRGNPMKISSSWVYLLTSEGALEDLIDRLDDPIVKSYFIDLHAGVVSFLQKHETALYPIIEQELVKNASWFQQYYADYQAMIKTGQPPISEINYGPITNMNFGPLQLFLPKRFSALQANLHV